jgi:hypothetical protein
VSSAGTYIESRQVYDALLTFQALALHSLQAKRSLRLFKQAGKSGHVRPRINTYEPAKLVMDNLSASQLLHKILDRELPQELAAVRRQQEENRVLDAITEMFGVSWSPKEDHEDQNQGLGDSIDQAPDEFEEEWVLV